MGLFYGGLLPNAISAQDLSATLGISTKSQSSPLNKGFHRLKDFVLQDQAAKLLPKERVCNCLKRRIDKTKDRAVVYNEVRKTAYWSNVQRCGSVWSCPVCAKKITEKRRLELKTASEKWKKDHNGSMLLLTLTNSHNASHSLNMLKVGQKKAMAYFFGDREGKRLLALLGRKHQITNYEVTHGKNGWHPHHHVLLFVETELTQKDRDLLQVDLAKHWLNCCKKAGLPLPDLKHGLDLKDGTYADQYIGKWGLEHEMTKGHVKKGKEGGLTPFDLLRASFEDEKAAKLFQEFVIAFKGARQLVWSRGLKALLLIEDQTDEQLAEETEQECIHLCDVNQFDFKLLCKYQKRAEFLSCIESDYEKGCFGCGLTEQLIENLKVIYFRDLASAAE